MKGSRLTKMDRSRLEEAIKNLTEFCDARPEVKAKLTDPMLRVWLDSWVVPNIKEVLRTE